MTDPLDYIKLIIWWPENQVCRWISAPRATADYYGWTQEFEVWRPKTLYTQDGRAFVRAPHRSGRGVAQGGKRIRISRAESTCGHPRGLTNQFTISNSMRTVDLAELANFTKGDWYWMEDLSLARLSKKDWARLYKGGTQGRRGGLVLNEARLRATFETSHPSTRK